MSEGSFVPEILQHHTGVEGPTSQKCNPSLADTELSQLRDGQITERSFIDTSTTIFKLPSTWRR